MSHFAVGTSIACTLVTPMFAQGAILNNQDFGSVAPTGTTVALTPSLAGTLIDSRTSAFSYRRLDFTVVSGSISTDVVRETLSGTLAFYFTIKVNANTTTSAAISILTLPDYLVPVDVGYLSDTSGVTPFTFFARLQGRVIQIGRPTDRIVQGTNTKVYFLRTPAIAYTDTQIAVWDQNFTTGPQVAVATFAPIVPAPGAGTLALVGLCVLGRRRRFCR